MCVARLSCIHCALPGVSHPGNHNRLWSPPPGQSVLVFHYKPSARKMQGGNWDTADAVFSFLNRERRGAAPPPRHFLKKVDKNFCFRRGKHGLEFHPDCGSTKCAWSGFTASFGLRCVSARTCGPVENKKSRESPHSFPSQIMLPAEAPRPRWHLLPRRRSYRS